MAHFDLIVLRQDRLDRTVMNEGSLVRVLVKQPFLHLLPKLNLFLKIACS